MSGRVALVTGAARGIGASTAEALAEDGWSLVLIDACADDPAFGYRMPTRDDLVAVGERCGPDTLTVVADVRDQSGLDAAVASATARFGRLDAVVAAAGAMSGGRTTWQVDDDEWEAVMGVNLVGVWRTIRATVPALLAQPKPRTGRIVAISSMGGTVGLPLLAPYVAAKHAVNGLVRSLAAELGPEGITVNAVAPGSTVGAMLTASAAVYGLTDVGPLAAQHLLGRALDPHEVAALIAWLCSDASSGMTGAVLPVDAGATAQ